MKKFSLFICTIIAFVGCTKLENDFTPTKEKIAESQMYEAQNRPLFDSATKKRLIEFTKHFYTNQQSIPECKSEWEKIASIGELSFNDVTVIRTDSCEWCYLLPIQKENNLVGLVTLSIQEDETFKNGNYQIKLELDSRVSKPKLITPEDTDFDGLSIYFQSDKKEIHPMNNVRSMTRAGSGERFLYSYYMNWYSYTENTTIIVSGSGRVGLDEMLDYYRIVVGVPYEVASIGGGYFVLYFHYRSWNITFYDLQDEAYQFGLELNNTLMMRGYGVNVFPLFNSSSSDGGGSGGGSGGSGSGGSSGGGGSGSSSGSGTKPLSDTIPIVFDKNDTDGYYSRCVADFKRRNPGKTPPTYYKSYGEFYMKEFRDKTSLRLTEKGKDWIKKTLVLLQENLDKVRLITDIELDDEAFTKAAFETHVDAYLRGGICELCIYDKLEIFLTVYPQDLLKQNGMKQVVDVGKGQVAFYLENPAFGLQQGLEFEVQIVTIKSRIRAYLLDKMLLNPRTRATIEDVPEEAVQEIFVLLYGQQIEHFKYQYGVEINFN